MPMTKQQAKSYQTKKEEIGEGLLSMKMLWDTGDFFITQVGTYYEPMLQAISVHDPDEVFLLDKLKEIVWPYTIVKTQPNADGDTEIQMEFSKEKIRLFKIKSKNTDTNSRWKENKLEFYCASYELLKHLHLRDVQARERDGEAATAERERPSDLFALTVFLCDGLLKLKDIETSSEPSDHEKALMSAQRFFRIMKKLPMELQKVECQRESGSPKNQISGKDSEGAFQRLAKKYTP